jgi:phosphatidyl-myo-inositol dimannoside synthase
MSDTLLLALNFPPFGGGIARMMGELALRYPPHQLAVSTGTWPGSTASDPRFPQAIDRLGVGAKRLRTLPGLVRWTWRADALVRRAEPRFVWCDEVKPAGYPAAWLRGRHGVPFGTIVHGADLLLLQKKIARSAFKRWTASQILQRCAVVVANSRWTAGVARTVLESLGCHALAADVRVVHLGTTPSRFRPGVDPEPLRRRYGLDGGPWLLTVARLDFHKGIDTVIRALPAIRARVPTLRYAVAGVGSRRSALEALVAELGLGGAVRLLGFVPDEDLPALYNAADVFVLVSRRYELLVEGFGIACVEASACGLPVIASRSGGLPEAVREGETGWLVDPDDPGALAARAVQLLEDEPLRRRLGAAGRAAVEAHYNWDRVAADLIGIDHEFRRPDRRLLAEPASR